MVSASEKMDPYVLGSVDNALRLLMLLSERPQVRITEAAAELDIANSTAHRLMATLVNRGFAVQDRSRAYHRGPMLATTPPGLPSEVFRRTVRREMLALAEGIDETCHFTVLEGNSVRFVDCVESSQILRIASRAGMLLPAHVTAAGKAMLSRLGDAELMHRYPRGTTLTPGRMPKDLAQLFQELATTRRRGYGINADESLQGVSAIGMHVAGPATTVVGALAIAVPSARWRRSTVEELAPKLSAAVNRLQDALRADADVDPVDHAALPQPGQPV
ncbi:MULTISPECIES: IclR family transcriptional regulator [unclassified Streptomyces]|uniref:IclR family transcriptional regulator n=1 Tax=unclassified Streptomyces TaxID=2593676 RepID=UPI002E2C781C|nr:IclR family transcriptional regulator [Streptomyces sp. NBC_00223]